MNLYKYIALLFLPLVCAWAFQTDSKVEPASNGDSNATAKDANASDSVASGGENNETLTESIGGDSTGMGIQRLVQVEEGSQISVSANYNTRYYYSSNPLKVRNVQTKDITLWENGLSVNVGLGQLRVMDQLITPSLMAMHMRIWNDPGKHYGHKFRNDGYDVDSQSANLSFNVPLSDQWSLNLGYGKSRAINFRTNEVSVYTDTPTVALSRMSLLGDNMLMINLGTAYNFNKASAGVDIPALNLLIPQDGSDMWATNLNVNYTIAGWQGIEKLSVSPSLGVSHSYYTNEKGKPIPSEGRQDWTLNYGLNATYQLTETLSIQAFGMFSKKTFNSYGKHTLGLGGTEYKNFDAGLAFSATFSF